MKYWANVIEQKPVENVAISFYGDGASNQGQVFEAYNMSKLWNLPMLYVCEDNKYGMGTIVNRSSASTDYYARGDYIPGIRADGMDVFAVREATRYAKEWAVKNGPVVLHMSTYRYHGHSMSDPGVTYRTREEVQETRKTRDPIQRLKNKLLEKGIATEDEIKAIDQGIKEEVDACVDFAKKSELPPMEELAKDIYLDKEYTMRGTSAVELLHMKQ